jgi:regulator of sigma E protease
MNILIFVIILLVLVLVHEFGHFFVAKKFGIRVDEFGFGFPPKLWGKKYGETEYTLNLLPLGGFVKIFGETPDEENTNGPDRLRSFVHKPKWQQALVLVAGVFMNFLLAWFLFSFGLMSGLPTSVSQSQNAGYKLENVSLVIVSVKPDSPAETAGLQTGDKIVSATHIHPGDVVHPLLDINPESLQLFILEHTDEEIEIGYIRSKEEGIRTAEVLVGRVDGKPAIGIAMDEIGTAKLGIFRAFSEGLRITVLLTKGTFLGLYNLIKDGLMGRGSMESITGPVGLVGFVGDAYRFGFVYLLSFAALISVNLAIINLLPFPALDGGRLLFLLIEKIKGSPLNVKVVNTANSIGFAILILLMLLVTYHDIVKLL